MPEKVIDIKTIYSDEISKINEILTQLEQGRITDLHPRVDNYGYLNTNASKLREYIYDLIKKIEYGKEPSSAILDELYD